MCNNNSLKETNIQKVISLVSFSGIEENLFYYVVHSFMPLFPCPVRIFCPVKGGERDISCPRISEAKTKSHLSYKIL